MIRYFGSIMIGVALSIAACGETTSHARGVFMLIDTSGTYTKEILKAQQIINFTLANLYPGDSFAVARIDSGSFSEKDIVAMTTFDSRPTKANDQKRVFGEQIDQFIKSVKGSSHTDISGGLLQAIQYLNETQAGKKTVLIFSDLEEDLEKGHVRDFPLELSDFQVIALNVTKLRSDNVDPREYLDRLTFWQARVEHGGGSWRVVNDLDRLETLLEH